MLILLFSWLQRCILYEAFISLSAHFIFISIMVWMQSFNSNSRASNLIDCVTLIPSISSFRSDICRSKKLISLSFLVTVEYISLKDFYQSFDGALNYSREGTASKLLSFLQRANISSKLILCLSLYLKSLFKSSNIFVSFYSQLFSCIFFSVSSFFCFQQSPTSLLRRRISLLFFY